MVLNQRQRRFLANSRNARHVVGCIAGKPHDIEHLLRPYTIGFLYECHIDGFILHGIPDNRLVRYQLYKILVTGNHHHRITILFGNAGIGSD